MSEPQDVTVETEVETQDVTVEPQETETQEDEAEAIEATDDADGEEGEVVEIPPEERLKRLERETVAKQKAIDRKTAAYHDLQRAHERQQQENQRLMEQLNTLKPVTEPQIDDYDTHDDYVNALADHRAELRMNDRQKEFIAKQQQAQNQALAAERAALSLQQEKDYLNVNPLYAKSKSEFANFIGLAKVPQEVEAAITMQAFKGNVPQIIDYFGSNSGERLDELETITKMSPTEAAIEIYKLQQKLGTPAKPKTKETPEPIKKLKGSSSNKPVSKMSGKELLKSIGVSGY